MTPPFAPRGNPNAQIVRDSEGMALPCPQCGGLIVTYQGWEWCITHEHADFGGPPIYVCGYAQKVAL